MKTEELLKYIDKRISELDIEVDKWRSKGNDFHLIEALAAQSELSSIKLLILKNSLGLETNIQSKP